MTAPRIAVLDPTPIGSLSATGQFKRMLFADWPHEQIIEVVVNANGEPCVRRGLGKIESATEPPGALNAVRDFRPDAFYVRPEAVEIRHLDLVLRCLLEIHRPAILHIMDDWVAGDFLPTPGAREKLLRIAQFIAQRASLRFTDGPAYVADFNTRLGAPFHNLLNGVDLPAWTGPAPAREDGQPFTITHMGNYVPVMSRQALIDIAAAVEMLRREFDVRFDVYVRDYVLEQARRDMAPFRSTRVLLQDSDFDRYIATLRQSDVNVYAYSQDPRSIQYMGKGIPNKTCELLAAARPILAYGPVEFAGIKYLQEYGAARVVRSRAELAGAIREIKNSPHTGVESAMKLVREHHDAEKIRARFRANVEAVSRSTGPVPSAEQTAAVRQDWWGSLRPEFVAHRMKLVRLRSLKSAAKNVPFFAIRAVAGLRRRPISMAALAILAATLTLSVESGRDLISGICVAGLAWAATVAGARLLELLGEDIFTNASPRLPRLRQATRDYQQSKSAFFLITLLGAIAGFAWWSVNWIGVVAVAAAVAGVIACVMLVRGYRRDPATAPA